MGGSELCLLLLLFLFLNSVEKFSSIYEKLLIRAELKGKEREDRSGTAAAPTFFEEASTRCFAKPEPRLAFLFELPVDLSI